ncbi:hypothetical protein S7335_4081 [Synechococcus sp. PCC 7335]|nr:hypothetical protein S7335_4081 [Synechococcus sp. PCC 7335]
MYRIKVLSASSYQVAIKLQARITAMADKSGPYPPKPIKSQQQSLTPRKAA